MILSKKEIEEIIAILKLEYALKYKDIDIKSGVITAFDKLDINHCIRIINAKLREEVEEIAVEDIKTPNEQIIKHLFTRHPKIIKHMPEEIKNKIILILL